MRKYVFLVMFFIISTVFVFGDIFDDVQKSKYSPILKSDYSPYNYAALIIHRENGRNTWKSNFSSEEDAFFFSEYENKSVIDYVEKLNIPYENLKINILPDFTWYDSKKKLIGDTYWDADLKVFVTFIWYLYQKQLTQPFDSEEISRNNLSNLMFFNYKMLKHIEYINNTINNKYEKNHKFIYFYYDSEEYDEEDDYSYSVYYGQNSSYEHYRIEGVRYKYTYVYLTDIDNSQDPYKSFCRTYKKYNMRNQNEVKQFWQDYRKALSDSFTFKDNTSFEVTGIK